MRAVSVLFAVLALATVEAQENTTATILETISGNEELSILDDLISLAGLNGSLQDPASSITLFAPTDDAFYDIFSDNDLEVLRQDESRGVLVDTLLYHVAPVILMTDTMFADQDMLVTMMDNKSAVIDLDEILESGDLLAVNGVIHLVDEVLIPPPSPTLMEFVRASPNHTLLAQALAVAGLADDLSAQEISLFMPRLIVLLMS